MINQVGPQGSLTYDVIGTNADGTPQYQQTTSLNPQAQAAYDAYQSNLTNVNNAANQALSQLGGMNLQSGPSGAYQTQFDGTAPQLGPLATTYAGADDFSADRQRVEDALWQRGASERASQEANLRSTLASKGIREGTAAWNSEMARLGAQNTDAQLATIGAAGNEQSRLVNLAQQAAQFGNQASLDQFGAGMQGAQFGQNAQQLTNAADLAAMQARNDAYGQQANVMGGLFGLGAGAGQTPQFSATPQVGVGATDLAGLVSDNYANQTSAYNAKIGALGGLAGTAAKFFTGGM